VAAHEVRRADVALGNRPARLLHERVPAIAILERNFTADRRDANAVAVAGDPGHDAFHVPPNGGVFERAESQGVHQGNRPRAHRKNVSDDAAYTRRGALIRLDERRMVVRLDLEDSGQAVADIDRARIFARALKHARPCRRQIAQMHA